MCTLVSLRNVARWPLSHLLNKNAIMLIKYLSQATPLMTWAAMAVMEVTALTHRGRDKMDAISQTTFTTAFFFNGNVWIPIKISLKSVRKGPINNIPALVRIMAWPSPGDKPLSERTAPSHYLNQWWLIYRRPQRVKWCESVISVWRQRSWPIWWWFFNTLTLTVCRQHFQNWFSWMKIVLVWFRFQLPLPKLTYCLPQVEHWGAYISPWVA